MNSPTITKYIFVTLLLLQSALALSQNTKELYSLEGLSFFYEVENDMGCITTNRLKYKCDTILDGLEYLKYGEYFFIRIEGSKVWVKDFFEGDILRFDYSLEIDDLIDLTSPISTETFRVIERDTVQLLDLKDRIKLTLEDTQSPWKITWIEGTGLNLSQSYNSRTTLICSKDDEGEIYLGENITLYECNQRFCPFEQKSVVKTGINDNITLSTTAEDAVSYHWDLGDGTTSNERAFSHRYQEKGCFNINLSYQTSCGKEFNLETQHNNCVDSLWVKQNDILLNRITFLDTEKGWGIRDSLIYTTQDGGKTWGTQFYDTTNIHSFLLRELEMTASGFGVVSHLTTLDSLGNTQTVILTTRNFGVTWESHIIESNNYHNINKLSISNDGHIFCMSSTELYHSPDYGNSWEKLPVSGINRYTNVKYLGDDCIVLDAWRSWCYRSGFVLRSTDLGQSWNRIEETYCDRDEVQSYFIDKNHGYVLSKCSTKTEDGGATWEEFESPNGLTTKFEFSNYNTGVIVTGRKIYSTKDGGKNWKNENCDFRQSITDLSLTVDDSYISTSGGVYRYLPNDNFICNTSLVTESPDNKFSIFPNPTSGQITIVGTEKISHIEVIDLLGSTIQTKELIIPAKTIQLDLDVLNNGTYFIGVGRDQSAIRYQKCTIAR